MFASQNEFQFRMAQDEADTTLLSSIEKYNNWTYEQIKEEDKGWNAMFYRKLVQSHRKPWKTLFLRAYIVMMYCCGS